MGHKHSVWDTDAHFTIDPITKKIKNESSKKNTLVQGDHNSERFSFDIPRFIEGHDMMLCDLIEVHYDNKETGTENVSSDYYEVDDKQTSPDDANVVIFSWLIEDTATKYAGTLEFSIKFKCMENGVCTYKWNTEENSDISVSKRKDNSGVVVERAPNVVDQWREQIFGDAENAVANINLAEKNALEAVQAEGAAQVKAIQDEGASQLEQIQVAGENIVEAAGIAEQNAKNVLANAIKGHLKGEVVTSDDVSPVEHIPEVWVHGKNLFGEGLLDGIIRSSALEVDDTGTGVYKSIILTLRKGTYTVSFSKAVNIVRFVGDGYYSATGTLLGVKSYTFTTTTDGSVGISFRDSTSTETVWDNTTTIQIETGESATDYEPYIDPTTVKIRRCGKNLIPYPYADGGVGDEYTNAGITYTVNTDKSITANGTATTNSYFRLCNVYFGESYIYENNTTGEFSCSDCQYDDGNRFTFIMIAKGTTVTNKVYHPQVESGTKNTEWESPKERVDYIPSSDGTVTGMTSLSPNMTILTDTEGVVIECEYIKDTNKVIEKLVNAIIGLGGTV